MKIKKAFLVLQFLMIMVSCGLAAGKKPINVVVIYTDDHRYSGIHALGGQAVQTPNMDRLCESGIVFSNAFLQGSFSGATCIPSRAMLHTGRNLFQLHKQGHFIPAQHTTMGEAFQQAGYHTEMIGKWHQDKASLARSFDHGGPVMSLGGYLVDHYRMPLWDWRTDGKWTLEEGYLLKFDQDGAAKRIPFDKKNMKRGPIADEHEGPHTSEIFADAAVEFLSGYSQKDPLFMYLAFHAPHDPRQAPEAYKAMYPEKEMVLPPSYAAQHPFDNGHMFLRDEQLAPWPRTPEVSQKQLSDYYAIITHLDAQIGKVIAALKASGMYDNTLIVLAGDSGLAVGNHGLMGKQNIYDEDGIHVPLVFSGGAVSGKSGIQDAFCYIHDIFPTLCDFAKIEVPESVMGKSLLPVIEGKESGRDYTYHAYKQYQRAYRKGQYKLIEYVRAPDVKKDGSREIRGSRVTQLFDVEADPWETLNLAMFPDYQSQIVQMQRLMQEAAKTEGDQTVSTGEAVDFWDYFIPNSNL